MRETYRPYSKIITLTDETVTTVNLTDSEGTALECNYIQVAAVSGSSDGYFFVTPTASTTAAVSIGNDLSASRGIVANQETGVVVLSLPASDVTSSIKISHTGTDPVTTYAITYGNVRLANTLRDNTLKRGN